MNKIVLFSLLMISYLFTDAQIILTNNTYAQNFNSYVGSAASVPAGWTTTSSGVQNFRGIGTGTNAAGGDWAYGTGNGTTGDLSMGSLTSGNTDTITLCVSFQNNTGELITALNIEYLFEQWRYANTTGFTVHGTGALASQDLSGLNQAASSTGTNGTPTNILKSTTIVGLNVGTGGTFGLCFRHLNGPSNDSGISVDDFALTLTTVALPITLTSFDARPMSGNSIELIWETATEENNSHFVIEHSPDGRNFVSLDHIAGAGNSTAPQYYGFMHKNAPRGNNYYRLRQVDFDGVYTYSPMRAVVLKGSKEIISYPTLAQDEIYIVLPYASNQRSYYQIFNMNGQLMDAQLIERDLESFLINIRQLKNGMYIIRVKTEGHEKSMRFVKH